jgi:cytoskeletal protein RodZ
MVDSKLSLEDKANDETLGMYVIRARKTVGLSRENLAQVTRIPLDIIGNIENSDWKKFPVEAYVRSYLNTICTTLKLDSKKVLQWFSIEYGSSYSTEFKADVDISSLPATSKKLKDADDYSRSSKAVPIVLILLAIAFLAVMNFMKRTETDSSALPSVENIPAEDSIPDMTHEAVIPEGAESVPGGFRTRDHYSSGESCSDWSCSRFCGSENDARFFCKIFFGNHIHHVF